jgi:rubrerythrin
MKEFSSINDILDFAIKEEEEASAFYKELAGKMEKPWMKEVFLEFAEEEKGHKEKLLAAKAGKEVVSSFEKVMDLKIGDYLIDVEPKKDMDYQHALVLAMKKEKAAFRLYTNLAERTNDNNLKNMFRALAQEEARHKLRFEIEYDDHVLQWN